MDLPASVANKRLTAWLNPLDATLTKNTGVGIPRYRNPTTITRTGTHEFSYLWIAPMRRRLIRLALILLLFPPLLAAVAGLRARPSFPPATCPLPTAQLH